MDGNIQKIGMVLSLTAALALSSVTPAGIDFEASPFEKLAGHFLSTIRNVAKASEFRAKVKRRLRGQKTPEEKRAKRMLPSPFESK